MREFELKSKYSAVIVVILGIVFFFAFRAIGGAFTDPSFHKAWKYFYAVPIALLVGGAVLLYLNITYKVAFLDEGMQIRKHLIPWGTIKGGKAVKETSEGGIVRKTYFVVYVVYADETGGTKTVKLSPSKMDDPKEFIRALLEKVAVSEL
jgi:hypothetical protein